MEKLKVAITPNVGKNTENQDHSYTAGRNVNGTATLGISSVVSLKNQICNYHMIQ